MSVPVPAGPAPPADLVYDDALLEERAREANATLLMVYGSRARGTSRPESDLDIAVLVDGVLSEPRDIDVTGFEAAFPEYDVDVRLLDGASPLFCFEVLRGRPRPVRRARRRMAVLLQHHGPPLRGHGVAPSPPGRMAAGAHRNEGWRAPCGKPLTPTPFWRPCGRG